MQTSAPAIERSGTDATRTSNSGLAHAAHASEAPPASSASASRHAPPTVKPLLRGVSHQISFFVAVVATAVLVHGASNRDSARAALVFGTSLATLFGVSALYHRVNWSNVARMRMRRLDHAAIFLLIAGGYTPLFALVPSSAGGHGALTSIWAGAMIGVVKSIAWPKAPKWVSALVCVTLGWTVVGQVIDRMPVVGSTCVWLLVASGISYSLGALVYALKRPDPWPRTFGYHEIFHLIVVAASVCLFWHVTLVMRAV